jgi:putative chitinase
MKIDPQTLVETIGCTPDNATLYAEPLSLAIAKWDVRCVPEFLAQVAHESALLSCVEENLWYTTPERIVRVFRKFDINKNSVPDPEEIAFALQFVRQPVKLANFVYANRFGNGDEASGDGWRYRGRGLIQVTFKDNYRAYETASGVPAVKHPGLLVTPQYAADSAAWYWMSRGLDALNGDVMAITKGINGGLHGYTERLALTRTLREAFA